MGFVDDPYPLIKGSIASICPIQIGGGIQNKVIESMALGVNTLVSPIASTAFKDFEKTGLMLCSNPQEWVLERTDHRQCHPLFGFAGCGH